MCDGEDDCQDGLQSDEKNCTTHSIIPTSPSFPAEKTECTEWMFTCANSKCIPYWWKCDSVNDCGDNSDEIGCSTTNKPDTGSKINGSNNALDLPCKQSQFMCPSGECIPLSWVCDSAPDCHDGEDEWNCHTTGTSVEWCSDFKCREDGACIAVSAVCDGHFDCFDNTDEIGCNEVC